MNIIETCFSFDSKVDGLTVSALRVEPVETAEVKGIVQLVHGMCEYKERYLDFMHFLAGQGYICVIHDHRGHGKSIKDKGDLGYMYEGGYHGLIEDTHEMLKLTKKYTEEYKKTLPYILLGHSMGSLVVRSFVKKYDSEIDKLIVVGCPSPQAGVTPGLILLKALKLIKGEKSHSKFADTLVMDSRYEKRFKAEKLKHSWVNSDKEAVLKYNADPFCNFTFTLNGYVNLVSLNKETYSLKGYELNNKELPVKFFSGGDDPCGISKAGIGKAMGIMKRAGYTNVKAKLYDGMRHEILNEPDKQKVYDDILTYIEK